MPIQHWRPRQASLIWTEALLYDVQLMSDYASDLLNSI